MAAVACGHRLQLRTIPSSGWICDGCESDLRTGEKAYSCRECDYDVCLACQQKPCQHPLSQVVHTHSWICDLCETHFTRGGPAVSCRQCDYDQCLRCQGSLRFPGCCKMMRRCSRETPTVKKYAGGTFSSFQSYFITNYAGKNGDVHDKTLAMGLVMAGEAMLETSRFAGRNQSKCKTAVQAFFNGGATLTPAQLSQLSCKMRLLLKQSKCNPTRLATFEEGDWSKKEASRTIACTWAKETPGDRTLFVGPLFFDQEPIDRAMTIVHEMSHACQNTDDIGDYGLQSVREMIYKTASDNADNWCYFTGAAFDSFHRLLGDDQVTVPFSHETDGGDVGTDDLMSWTSDESPAIEHISDWHNTVRDEFTVCFLGDMMGKTVEFHSMYAYWTVSADGTLASVMPKQPSDASGKNRFEADTPSSPFRITSQGTKYTALTDGLNKIRLIMTSRDSGFGFCACGGSGRSFVSIRKGKLKIVNGRMEG